MRSISLMVLLAFLMVACKDKKKETTAVSTRPVDITQVVGVGKIEPENEIIQLSAEVPGIVQKIYKTENDSVRKADVILELKHNVDDANIAQLKSASATQAAEIKVDEDAIRESQIRYGNANTEVQRLQNLLAKGAATRQEVDNASTDMQSFQANAKKLQAAVSVSQLKWADTKSQVAIAQAQLQQKFIKSPINGVLLNLNIQTGNYIDNSQILAQINPEGKTIAVCEIDERFADRIQVGQNAVIRNSGALDTLSTGKVYFAGSYLKKKSLFTDQPGEKEDRRVREIKILLDNPGKLLLNSRVECVVFISKNNP